ncbi:MAG: acetyl-CoA carboxylase biotin carboxyl carrier protein subunit [Lachnospiraceae bacterium]|jgi:biotin carboxyl carrier protein|nr:acetyl-CoA carboxylase biotin carboxyl carrier protein subunit [Lachnospiraceae bacterium]
MSKYRITLDGKTYEMEIELMGEGSVSPVAPKKETAAPVSAPKAVVESAPAKSAAVAGSAGAVVAPMPGTVIRIEKGEGSAVKAGELVLILEAMKMENEILAPVDGTITAMNCTAGGTVAGGDVLFEVK